ncbi:hypothetical protein BB560_000290 [Smittium megazygosporum]|uniref:Brl1/Brr6 domain-containing protein n=1 Tax=Smittium megazygosporum TaxID=133381 RepID=A0A2T9ZKT6_9FUNG|nr:hypothetical protein BB560_000290 [Smittium megazygosporum]
MTKFSRADNLFPKSIINNNGAEPMNIDEPDEASDWLKLEPREPARKRPFLEVDFANSAKIGQNAKFEGFGVGGPFLFRSPIKMEKVQDIDFEKMDIDASKPVQRGNDNNPVSMNAIKKTSKGRNMFYSKLLSSKPSIESAVSETKSVDTNNSLNFEKLSVTSKKSVKKPVVEVDSSSDSSYSSDNVFSPKFQDRKKSPNSLSKSSAKKRTTQVTKSRSILKNIQAHKDIPYVVSGYLFFNMCIASIFLVILIQIIHTIYGDIDKKYMERSQVCAKNYIDNRCDPSTRVPAMESKCLEWQICKNMDPSRIGRGRIFAETFAEIINGFIELISWKAMLFFFMLLFGTIYFSNVAFSNFRKSRNVAQESSLLFPKESPGFFFMPNNEHYGSAPSDLRSNSNSNNIFTPLRLLKNQTPSSRSSFTNIFSSK